MGLMATLAMGCIACHSAGMTPRKVDPRDAALAALQAADEADKINYAHLGRTPPPSAAMLDAVLLCRNEGVTWARIAEVLGRAQPNVVATFRPYLVEDRSYRLRTTDDE